jgi:hypothetical protein
MTLLNGARAPPRQAPQTTSADLLGKAGARFDFTTRRRAPLRSSANLKLPHLADGSKRGISGYGQHTE